MGKLMYLSLMVFAGFMIGFQSPINAMLSKKVGILESSFLSFLGGTIALAIIVFLFGKGRVAGALEVPYWQLFGGILGAIVVLNTIICVPHLGVMPTMVAMILGNLVVSAAIDHFGWFGIPVTPFSWQRFLSFILMFAGLMLAFKK